MAHGHRGRRHQSQRWRQGLRQTARQHRHQDLPGQVRRVRESVQVRRRHPRLRHAGPLFVGQRAEPFAVNLGTIFDLIHADLAVIANEANRGAVTNPIGRKNITTIALELPVACVRKGASGADSVIGGWTTSSVRQARVINPQATYRDAGQGRRRVGAGVAPRGPLVNEVVIGLKDEPLELQRAEGRRAVRGLRDQPDAREDHRGRLRRRPARRRRRRSPRADLVAAFLTGVTGVNANGSTAEYLRLNTALPITVNASQNDIGALGCFTPNDPANPNNVPTLNTGLSGCDPAGFPNGQRPGDDTVDIAPRDDGPTPSARRRGAGPRAARRRAPEPHPVRRRVPLPEEPHPGRDVRRQP
ncbi:MAG: DUF4331 family protein [Polyangiaceae bacterium]